uniref:Uncharacterized protein n=1 Tax=Sphaerodactylus townsendi TaxID=933632 RepID=A0ACB8FAL5_9SAUR
MAEVAQGKAGSWFGFCIAKRAAELNSSCGFFIPGDESLASLDLQPRQSIQADSQTKQGLFVNVANAFCIQSVLNSCRVPLGCLEGKVASVPPERLPAWFISCGGHFVDSALCRKQAARSVKGTEHNSANCPVFIAVQNLQRESLMEHS